MNRPLVVTDCDEVLLHMVRHFREWLAEAHDVEFLLEGRPFAQSMRRRGQDRWLDEAEMEALLGGFFETQMPRQTPIAGAIEAVRELQRVADLVVLTNLAHERREARARQLAALGIEAPVYTNQGPKGAPLARIVAEHGASRAVFIDDIAHHHQSAAQLAPGVLRLHFCGEPAIAPHVPCAHLAGAAHARIDRWDEALPWLLRQLECPPRHGDALDVD